MSMSLNNVPSSEEVMGWNPQNLADYMRKLKLIGCGKTVMTGNITGAQFMQMTESDLQVFPCHSIPKIIKCQSDINKGDQKMAFRSKSKAPRYPQQVLEQDEEDWNSDEFDYDSDQEGPHWDEREHSDISGLTEPKTAEQQDNDETNEEYEVPEYADAMKPPLYPRVAKRQDDHYRDPVHDAERTSKPPKPLPRFSHVPQRPFKAPAGLSKLHTDRSKKPEQPGPSQKNLTKSKGSAVKAPGSSPSKTPLFHPPAPRASKLSRASSVPPEPAMVNNQTPAPRKDLDPSWYKGKLTRHQAEVALREVNKDGAFLVRDSSNRSHEHPYTLMLLKQDKVYNIKIRNQGNSFSLGSKLNSKIFPGVKEMITHHTRSPLLLIDATDQSSDTQSQCCLLHPVGL